MSSYDDKLDFNPKWIKGKCKGGCLSNKDVKTLVRALDKANKIIEALSTVTPIIDVNGNTVGYAISPGVDPKLLNITNP